jgi:hypothetical protein
MAILDTYIHIYIYIYIYTHTYIHTYIIHIVMKTTILQLVAIYSQPKQGSTQEMKLLIYSYYNKTCEIYWLNGKHSPLQLENYLLIYRTVLKPVWVYGIELRGCASKSNIAVIHRYQSKLLGSITNAPRYVSHQSLHSDLHIPHVHTVFRERRATHRAALDSHPNPLSWNH